MGLAGVPSYVAYTAVIPPVPPAAAPSLSSNALTLDSASAADDGGDRGKVGITLSRIPIGVYVREVDATGDAFAAGVVPGSVLVDVNGLGVLGEPSHKLLERLWQYEGHINKLGAGGGKRSIARLEQERWASGSSGGVGGGSKSKAGGGKGDADGGATRGPVALRLIHSGRLYTALLLSPPPFGISWAPCGNFALVQRSYSHAEKAGVRRGCIVASVSGRSFRRLDHGETAAELKVRFAARTPIAIGLAYTPAASRTGYFEKKKGGGTEGGASGGGKPSAAAAAANQPAAAAAADGLSPTRVRVRTKTPAEQMSRPHPLEYTLGSLLRCGGGATYQPVDTATGERTGRRRRAGHPIKPTPPRTDDAASSSSAQTSAAAIGGKSIAGPGQITPGADALAELAGRVASGELIAPTGLPRRGHCQAQLREAAEATAAASRGQNVPPRYLDCPPLPRDATVRRWSAFDAALYSMKFHLAGYDDENFRVAGGVVDAPPPYCDDDYDDDGQERWNRHQRIKGAVLADESIPPPPHTAGAKVNLLRECASTGGGGDGRRNRAAAAFGAHLLQLMGMVSSSEDLLAEVEGETTETIALDDGGADGPRPLSDRTAAAAQKLGEDVMNVLLDLVSSCLEVS